MLFPKIPFKFRAARISFPSLPSLEVNTRSAVWKGSHRLGLCLRWGLAETLQFNLPSWPGGLRIPLAA